MKTRYLFEFMDLSWLPSSLRKTETDILDMCNGRPFRRYLSHLTDTVLALCRKNQYHHIVELGAGSAPLTRSLLSREDVAGLNVALSDRAPDLFYFAQLEKRAEKEGKINVSACQQSVDFTKPHQWAKGSLLVLSSTFHHVPPEARKATLQNLLKSGDAIVIAEGIRKNAASILYCLLGGWLAALLAPLALFGRPGRLRRIFWCWVFPIAPICFVWDGIASTFRCWEAHEWTQTLNEIEKNSIQYELDSSPCSMFVKFSYTTEARQAA